MSYFTLSRATVRPGLVVALLATLVLAGCSSSEDPGATAKNNSAKPDTANTTPGTVTTYNDDGTTTTKKLPTGAQNNSPAPSSGTTDPAVDLDNPAVVLMKKMVQKYSKATSYADAGTLKIQFELNGQNYDDQQQSFSVSYEAPKKLRLQIYDGMIVSDGESIYTTLSDVRGYVIKAPVTAPLTLQSVYADDFTYYTLMQQRAVGNAPQLELLLANSFFDDMMRQSTSQKVEKDGEIDGETYKRVKLGVPDGEMVFWIHPESYILRRVEYPVDSFRENLKQQGEVGNVSVVADFNGARMNEQIDPIAFKFDLPEGVKFVKRFVGPSPPEVLGKKAPEFEFADLEGNKITSESLAGKVVLLDFWATWCVPCLENMPNLQKVAQQYKDNPDVVILAVNIEGDSVNNDAVKEAMQKTGATLTVARDPNTVSDTGFSVQSIPNMVMIGKDGTVQENEVGLAPNVDVTATLTKKIDTLIAGGNLYEQRLEEFEHAMMQDAPPQGAGGMQVAGEGAATQVELAPPSPPKNFELVKVSTITSLQEPGNFLVVPGQQGNRLFVLDGWRKVAEIDGSGKVIAQHELEIPETSVIMFLRTAVDGQGKRFYAGSAAGQQQVHVFDENWKTVLSFPQDADHAGLADAQLTDLDGDGSLELCLGYFDVVGVQAVSLKGERLWSNRSIKDVFSVAVTVANDAGHHSLLCTNGSGTIAVIDNEGQSAHTLSADGLFLQRIYVADINGQQQVAVGPGQFGETLVGLDLTGKVLWERGLPGSVQKFPWLEGITHGTLVGDAEHWIAAAADGSIQLIAPAGDVLDEFNYGQALRGMAAVQMGGKRLFLTSTEAGLEVWEAKAK